MRLGWILADHLDSTISTTARVHSLHAFTTYLKTLKADIQSSFQSKSILNNIGDSCESALKRLKGIEKRFKRDPTLKLQYAAFLDKYLSLGHMRRMELSIAEETISFYLPHHYVFKTVGQASKIRIVFDAFCRSNSGVSLNDALLVRSTIQQDLISILMRFRFFTYVITADIIKMYRQILMHPSQMRLQRILWRNDPSANVDTYELTTVTYDTASASFLVTRCLKQPNSTLINLLAVQHASFEIFMSMTCSLERIQSTN
ncbi:PREDICTED: uncharacterized protein LOC105621812 [Atta cephalotes]|uniref:Uncharacterized protein n=1 Tax=Atta cephalotes TaxID=12957 RepID=A0A158NM96_ATTCE|nr:PREDICTED: uncharacterized protein LOC105621812 [Atta cephalotes]